MHWYTKEGYPRHGASMAEARREGYRPSVTEVTGTMAKPGLEYWKIGKAIEAAMEEPWNGEEARDQYIGRIRNAGARTGQEAANFGTRIHKFLEYHFSGKPQDNASLLAYVRPLLTRWEQKGVEVIETEKVVVNNEYGFGGTCDGLIQPASGAWHGVIDFKTTNKREPRDMVPYLEHKIQLAAYGATLFDPTQWDEVKLINIFISSTNPGAFRIVMHEEPIVKLFNTFLDCMSLWIVRNEYDPLEVKDG